MERKSIVILPYGTDVPEEIKSKSEIIGFLQEDGSLEVESNTHDGPKHFDNVNEFFSYVGGLKKDV